jgi:hypothetical protein
MRAVAERTDPPRNVKYRAVHSQQRLAFAFAAKPRAFNWQTNRLRPSCREFSTVKEDQ